MKERGEVCVLQSRRQSTAGKLNLVRAVEIDALVCGTKGIVELSLKFFDFFILVNFVHSNIIHTCLPVCQDSNVQFLKANPREL